MLTFNRIRCDSRGRSPLHIRVVNANLIDEIVKMLQNGADPNISDDRGRYPLHDAVSQNWEECADYLIRYNALLDVQTPEYGLTPLHMAAGNNNTSLVHQLLNKGASLNIQSVVKNEPHNPSNGWTPLHTAVHCGAVECVVILLENNADQNLKNVQGDTPLDIARKIRREDIVRLLECHKITHSLSLFRSKDSQRA